MVKASLHLSDELDLPLRAVTEPIGIFANRGKGKSSTGRRFVEQLYAAGLPSVILDIKGDHYGIRSSADGKGAGLPFVIFGGEHADVPLEEGSGPVVARFIAEQRIPAVIDLSGFSKTKARRWVMEFAEELYRVNRDPLMVVVDEADVIIPQRLSNDLLRLLGALEDIAKRGRQRGLGITVLSQRVQDVNKSVTELLETLLLGAITGPRMRKAIMEWIDDHADPEEAKAVISSLSSLDVGEVWVWSPGFLRLLARTRVELFETFDSFKTPEPGEARRIPRTMADVDLAHVSAEITATIERAKAEDPKELRKQLEVERTRLRLAREALVGTGYFTADQVGPDVGPRITELWSAALSQPEPERVEVPVPLLEEELLDKFEGLLAQAAQVGGELAKRWEETLDAVDAGRRSIEAADVAQSATQAQSVPRTGGYPSGDKTAAEMRPPPASVSKPKRAAVVATGDPDPRVAGDGAPRRVLVALATAGLTLPDRVVAARAGVARSKSTWRNAMSRLRAWGYIEGGSELTITPAGLGALGRYEPLPEGRALCEYWLNDLGATPARLFRVLLDAYPEKLSSVEMCERANVDRTLSTYRNAMSKLRGLDLVTTDRDAVSVNDELGKAWRS